MIPRLIHSVDGCEIWHGDCLDPDTVGAVMQGRIADLLHVDAPYSARTHAKHCTKGADGSNRRGIEYAAWSRAEIVTFGEAWLPATQGWATTITDYTLTLEWSESFAASGLYVFTPLPWVEIGSRCRLSGDGPSSWTCWTVVARPRHEPYSKWGTLPGAYVENVERRVGRIIGGKSLAMTTKFLSDYSRRGDLVLDPCLGGGTTIMAARMSGRRCIGIEKDEARAELCARLVSGKREQLGMFEAGTPGGEDE